VLFTVNEAEGTDYTIGADSDADRKMP
jgi:hypothetical protein